MEIGDKGYLIEVGMKDIRGDKWLKPPLYELIEIQKGFKVTHYVFRSIKGGYKRTMTNTDFDLGEWAFCDTPEPISAGPSKEKAGRGYARFEIICSEEMEG